MCYSHLFRYIFILSLINFIPLFIQAQVFIIQDGNKALYPAIESEYLEDEEKKYSFEQIQNQSFIPYEKEHLNFGQKNTVYWFRFKLINESKYNDWRLLSSIPYHDYIDFWIKPKNGKWKHLKVGAQFPYKKRGNEEHAGFVFPLDLKYGEETTIYFRLESVSPLSFPLELLRKKQLDKRFQRENIYYGIYFGILLVMFLYNTFIWFVLRDNTYIYYTLSIFCTFTLFSSVAGYLFMYIYPEIPIINTYLAKMAMGFLVIFTALFAIKFLSIKKYNIWAYRVLIFDIILSFPTMVFSIDIYPAGINALIALHSFVLLTVGIIAWWKGNRLAIFYTVAWVSYIFGGLASSLRSLGLLPFNIFTNHAPEVGSALEVILLSLALAERYRIIKKEKEAATRKSLEIEKKAKEELEEKVEERTLELQERNEELNQTNEELDTTLYTVELQKNALEEQHTLIQSSINYAKRIQKAILPSEEKFKKSLSDAFILFRPRDVVSGDFYYLRQEENRTILILADCTGHGIPGAFMSMIGVNLIERVLAENKNIQTHEALQKIDTYLAQALSTNESQVRDGMDMAICIIEQRKQKLWFSGAQQPLIRIRDGQHTIYKKSVQAVGGSERMTLSKIPLHEIDYLPQDRFFIFSDGYQDQFGGEQSKKYLKSNFRELLISTSTLSFEAQKTKLDYEIENWMQIGREKQTDDILVIGFAP